MKELLRAALGRSSTDPHHGERGQAIGLAAVVMVAMVGLLAFVIDAGIFLTVRRDLQHAADAAALAGVPYRVDDLGKAYLLAQEYATANAQAPGAVAARLCVLGEGEAPSHTISDGQQALGGGTVYTLTVTTRCVAGYTFGRILGLTNTPISATATAALGALKTAACVAPFGVDDVSDQPGKPPPFGYAFGEVVRLKIGDMAGGNSHILALDGRGASAYKDWLAGNCGPGASQSIGDTDQMDSEPGKKTGPTEQGLEARGLVKNPGSPYTLDCPDNLADVAPGGVVARPESVCLAAVPIVDSWVDVNGRSQMAIKGFGLFFIVGYLKAGSDMYIDGAFVRSTVVGDIAAYSDFGTTVARLIR